MRYLLSILVLSIIALESPSAFAEKNDTLSLSREETTQLFMRNSLVLIAAHYNIDIAHAQTLDARLWNNPEISYSQHLYDPTTRKYFDAKSATGEWAVQISQLFSIAGRHSNMVKLARIREKMSELEFNELVRSLIFEVNDNYSKVAADFQKENLLLNETGRINELLEGTKQEVNLGVMPGNEVLRLQAELQEVEAEEAQTYAELNDAENNLRVLLNINEPTFIRAEIANVHTSDIPSIDSLEQLAIKRPDVLLSQQTKELAACDLHLQKSLAWPDLTLMAEHDLNASSVHNYNGIGIGLPLPIFNRNQGLIKAADYSLQQAEINDSIAIGKARNEIQSSFNSFVRVRSTILNCDQNLSAKLDEMNTNAFINYKKRYINLVDFLDQVRTYTNAYQSLIDLNYQYSDAVNQLNFAAGKTILNP